MVKIALIDDHQLFRKSMVMLLSTFREMEVVFDGDDGNEFLHYAQNHPVDVLLLDIQMPKMHGFDICKKLREIPLSLPVLVISQLTSKEAIHQMMACGANGFFTKNASPEMLQQAIMNVLNDGYYFDETIGNVIREAMFWQNDSTPFTDFGITFTNRELEIIRLVCKEFNSKQIAETLHISVRTVEKHRMHMMEKTQSKNFIGVVLYAIKTKALAIEEV